MKRETFVLFGGTFDPVHRGHITVAKAAADYLRADRLVFIPVRRSPLKNAPPEANEHERLAMVKLAIATDPRFDVSDFEVQGPVPSYTLHTVKYFRERFGSDASLHWLVGADAIVGLARWYGVLELLELCALSVMHRAGCPSPDFSGFESVWGKNVTATLERQVVPTPLIAVSSTEVRRRLRLGQDVSALLSPDVRAYIEERRLYRR